MSWLSWGESVSPSLKVFKWCTIYRDVLGASSCLSLFPPGYQVLGTHLQDRVCKTTERLSILWGQRLAASSHNPPMDEIL